MKLEAVCRTCKKKFLYYPLSSKGQFCSYSCYWKFKKGKIVRNSKLIRKGEHLSVSTEFKKGHKLNYKGREISNKCKVCGNESADFLSNNRKYCSYRCYWEDKKNLMKNVWSNKEYKDKTIRAILKGLIKRPTSLEKQMIDVIKRNNLPYKYVGDGSFLIGFKNPDFVNVNGEKKLIEVGNVFHHQNDYIEKRKSYFAKYGWKSYIFINDIINENYILEVLKHG
jgi:hypothetical protein